MEDTLRQLAKEIITPKFGAIKNSCNKALSVLQDAEVSGAMEAWQLREICLEPLQMALESRAKKLAYHALAGIQHILRDERFHSSLESGEEERWLPVQVLNALYMTPHLPDDIQVDIMKLLLNMTLTTAWCMNAHIVTKISQVYIETYRDSMASVRAPIQAAMTQMLNNFVERLREMEDNVVDDGDDMLADFKSSVRTGDMDSVVEEVVALLKFLIDKLEETQSNMGRQVVPLLLEGVHAILSKLPSAVRHNTHFQDLIWKQLCPLLICLMGIPKSLEEKGPGRAASAPSTLGPTAAKVIYSIAAELVRLVGGVGSLRPVLESLFHRILLFPPAQQRVDALKVVKELLSDPERLVDITAPVPGSPGSKNDAADMTFIKMILEAVQECCHCNDSSVCFTSVTCVDGLLRSLDALSHGHSISDAVLEDLNKARVELEKAQAASGFPKESPAQPSRNISHRDSDGGSVNASSTVEHCDSTRSPPDSPRPVFDSDTNSEASSSDVNVVKRVTRIRLTDVEADEDPEKMSKDEAEKQNKEDEPASSSGADGGQHTGEDVVDKENESVHMDTSDSVRPSLKKKPSEENDEASQRRKAQREQLAQLERENAEECVRQMRSKADYFLSLPSITDVDEALQLFASNFCAGLSHQQWGETVRYSNGVVTPTVVLNADGVYTATIAALQLSYKLTKAGYYTSKQPQHLSITQSQFVDGVLGSGLLLYLSPTWLAEVYSQTVSTPLMDVTQVAVQDCPLLQMLEDLDGLGSHEVGGQLMFDYRCQEDDQTVAAPQESQLKVEAGQFLAQRILMTCWEGVLDVLSVLLEGKSSCGISFSLGLLLGTEGAREETQRARDAICLSLSGLRTASRLCCTLGLQSRCGSAFAQLANTSCVHEDLRVPSSTQREAKGALKAAVLREKPKPVRLHEAHVLSMDVVMTTGLEVGSHAADCWKHVFRCCAHISELEHTYFSRGNHQSSLPRIQHGHNTDAEANPEGDSGVSGDMFEAPVMTPAAVPVAPRINVVELIKQSSMESGWETSLTGGGVLTSSQAAKALCGLSQEVDSLFEDAARKLNLQALLSFLTELGEASRHQLHHLQHQHSDITDPSMVVTSSAGQGSRLPTNALHLYRLQEVLMTVVHSSRPLLHLVRVWSAVAPYLVEATGHQDRSISKMSVTCIHDFIVAMLSGHQELPHFHVNEFLCKTFEDMLCLELCDSDVQDQIVCSICELVEACTQELQSGWRPLFGALRSVRIEFTANEEVNEARQRHVAAVLDVFEVYLNTENILVFANATVDCILCLLKYVHGPGMFEDVYEDDGSDSGSDVGVSPVNMDNLCVPALGYLTRCTRILASMWHMPQCPAFKGAFRIEQGASLRLVDPVIPHMDVEPLDHGFLSAAYSRAKDSSSQQWAKSDQRADSHSITSVDSGTLDAGVTEEQDGECQEGPASLQLRPPTLSELDKGSGVLQVWYLLLDGLATAIASCPRSFQPQTLTTLFDLLRDTASTPGPKFSLYCVNHLLLPMLQSWLRRGSRLHGYWDTGTVNFKQCCGLTADLVVELIGRFVGQTEEIWSLELMLRQLYDVLTECVAQPIENLSLLGCSCIRHVLLSAGPTLTEPMWNISAQCFARTVTVTTYNLRQLMALFHPNSDNFYGDIGQVKVATRKDCVAMDSMRLRQLARQVFLLDSQITSMPPLSYDTEEDKSYVFLLYSPEHLDSINPDHIMARVPFRDMVVGLLSNQLLLQTLGAVLLDGASSKLEGSASSSTAAMPGLLRYMSTRNVLSFLDILESSFQFACQFDARPGLKFLLQKVAGLEVATNQYRLAAASMVMYLHTLTHLCAHLDRLDVNSVQDVLTRTLGEEQSGDGTEKSGVASSDVQKDSSASADSNKPACGTQASLFESAGSSKHDPTQSSNNVTAEKSGEMDTEPTKTSTKASSESGTPENEHSSNLPCTDSDRPAFKHKGQQSTAHPWDSADIFLPILYQKSFDVCQQYADIVASSDQESLVDRMASRPLFFLVAQPEDISEMTQSLKRKKKEEKKSEGGGGGGEKGKEGGGENSMPATPFTATEAVQETSNSPVETAEASEPEGDEQQKKPRQSSLRSNSTDDDDDALRICSKRQLRAEQEGKVYLAATDNVIQTLIGQYKKHKQQNAMPNTLVQFARRHRPNVPKVPRREPVDEAINKQQQASIMKDSEAQQRSWSQMLVTVLQLFLELPDPQFTSLLPAASTAVTHLVCYAHDAVLRDTLAQWFQRLGQMYGFAPKFKTKPKTGAAKS